MQTLGLEARTVHLGDTHPSHWTILKVAGVWGSESVYLLYILGPRGRVRQSHETTVGQNGAHNEEAE